MSAVVLNKASGGTLTIQAEDGVTDDVLTISDGLGITVNGTTTTHKQADGTLIVRGYASATLSSQNTKVFTVSSPDVDFASTDFMVSGVPTAAVAGAYTWMQHVGGPTSVNTATVAFADNTGTARSGALNVSWILTGRWK